jgi:HlyD family secretion protein
MNKKQLLIGGGVLTLLIIGFSYFYGGSSAERQDLIAKVRKGKFQIDITTTGELEAKNSVRVQGPTNLRAAQIWNVKIESIVPEGTIVNRGDFIARLDKSELSGKISNAQTELSKIQSQYTQTKLDTALQLREARDKLVNLKYAREEQELVLEQSKFEPPATIKKAQIDVEKAQRAYDQAKSNYDILLQQSIAKMEEATANLSKAKRDLKNMTDLLGDFTIMAPEEGMVIYEREWNGRRKEAGSTISPWDPTVATLPDLTKMISRTYVNEVDIRKVKAGQFVHVGLDAFPDKKLTGEVVSVANVGEQKGNSDAKVFEVTIEINETDTTLRPAMTTSNTIIAEVLEEVVSVPLESVHTLGDSLTYVFMKDGGSIVRKEVRLGKTNSNEVVILEGLSAEQSVLLSKPVGMEESALITLKAKH